MSTDFSEKEIEIKSPRFKDFADRFKLICKKEDIPKMADAKTIKKETIYDWMRGNRLPNGVNLIKIKEYFNVSINWLLTDDVEGNKFIEQLPAPSEDLLSKVLAQSLVLALNQININISKINEILEEHFIKTSEKIFARFDKIDKALYDGPKSWDGTNRRHGKERRAGNKKRKSKNKKLLKKSI